MEIKRGQGIDESYKMVREINMIGKERHGPAGRAGAEGRVQRAAGPKGNRQKAKTEGRSGTQATLTCIYLHASVGMYYVRRQQRRKLAIVDIGRKEGCWPMYHTRVVLNE